MLEESWDEILDEALKRYHLKALEAIERGKREGAVAERARIRRELVEWLVGRTAPEDAGLINGRRIVSAINRICPKGE